VFAALAVAISLAIAPRPHIVWKPIPYGPKRRAEMAAYAAKHYGIHSWRLHPRVIVEHYTGSNGFASAWNTFAADTPDPELGVHMFTKSITCLPPTSTTSWSLLSLASRKP